MIETKKPISTYARRKFQATLKKARRYDSEAMCQLGLMYAEGYTVMQSNLKAYFWLCQGITGLYDLSVWAESVFNEDGMFISKTCRKAVVWLRQAAEGGLSGAQYALGTLMERRVYVLDYEDNEDIYDEFLKFWTEDEARNPIICSRKSGSLGTDKDAVHWYKKAACQGHRFAQLRLGDIYQGISRYSQFGEDYDASIITIFESDEWDVRPNLKEAVKWYGMAAKQGSRKAKAELERLANG